MLTSITLVFVDGHTRYSFLLADATLAAPGCQTLKAAHYTPDCLARVNNVYPEQGVAPSVKMARYKPQQTNLIKFAKYVLLLQF
jgi:hypothetical protein